MTIKIFDLCCANGHVFEGWFSSAEDFESQNSKKLIACPICSDTHIERRPSPSRIGRSSKGSDAAPPDLEAMRERFEAIMAQVREAAVKAEPAKKPEVKAEPKPAAKAAEVKAEPAKKPEVKAEPKPAAKAPAKKAPAKKASK